MLKQRLFTILVALPVAILAIWYLPDQWFAALTAIIIAICAWEWSQLIAIQHPALRILYVVLILLTLGLTFIIPIIYWFSVAVGVWLWALGAVISFACGRSAWGFQHRVIKYIQGFLMLVPCWLAMNVLRNTSAGPVLLIFVLILVWAVDSGAYIAGRLWGLHLLIPRVSPKKTWEGFLGGVILALMTAFIYGFVIDLSMESMWHLAELSFITVLFAVLGDLFESMLKRQVGIKDSGDILPGHGGFLDRFDSAIAALPIFALGLLIFG